MASQRIYIVRGPNGLTKLVKASVASQAVTHVAKGEFTARVASQDDLVYALSNGIKVETYGAEQGGQE